MANTPPVPTSIPIDDSRATSIDWAQYANTPAPSNLSAPIPMPKRRKAAKAKVAATGVSSKAFVYNTYRHCDDRENVSAPDSIQSVPNVIVWTLPFAHPSTFNHEFDYRADGSSASAIDAREAIKEVGVYVIDGVTNAVVGTSKRSHVTNLQVQCIDEDNVNMGIVSPGDWIFCSMFTDQAAYEDVLRRLNATPPQPINGFNDGLKFVGRVQSVRRVITVNPITGAKNRHVFITGAGFTEFDTAVYYDPALTVDSANHEYFATQFLGSLLTSFGATNQTSQALPLLITSLLGKGPANADKVSAPKGAFYIPSTVGKLLDANVKEEDKTALTYSAVMVGIFGVQKYNPNPTHSVLDGRGSNGFTPMLSDETGVVDGCMRYITKEPLKGTFAMQLVPWLNVPIWGILQNFLMPSINEMYTCLRLDAQGRVAPTFVARQIPFNTDKLRISYPSTRFLNLPRWKIEEPQVLNYDTCKSDAMRVNYVQVRSQPAVQFDAQESISRALIEPVWDRSDITRSGLRAQFSTTNNMLLDADMEAYWTALIADRSMDGHLKLSGQVTTIGIQEPICEGDNLQYDDMVFHIEGLQHMFQVNPNNGQKRFATTILVSNGVPTDGNILHAEVTQAPGYDSPSSKPLTNLE